MIKSKSEISYENYEMKKNYPGRNCREVWCIFQKCFTMRKWKHDARILVDLAIFYEVDIKEIIDGERKSENMEKEAIETLEKVADYATEEKKMAIRKTSKLAYFSIGIAILIVVIFSGILISKNIQ